MSNKAYINPTPISLLAKMVKLSNVSILEEYSVIKKLSSKEKKILFKKMLKPNYYYPTVIQTKNKEKLQCIGIPDD